MPWGISHKYKFIFIHIPKTAGTTICSSWEGSPLKHICKKTGVLGGTHKTALELQTMFPAEFKTYFKFSVVRNPYDRFVSKFFFKQLNKREDFNLQWTDKESEGLLPQMYWITDRSQYYEGKGPYDRPDVHYGKVIMDKILRFENLVSELSEVFEQLGIEESAKVMPHFRKTRSVGTYHNYFDTYMKALVTFLYREDLERLNYTWKDRA